MKKSPSACTHDLLQTVARAIDRYHMFTPGDAVLAGVSGGPDSVALLHILMRIAPRFSMSLGVAHLDHCLRGSESDRDARFVADLSHRLQLPFFSSRQDIVQYRRSWKLSTEEAARRARYAFFENIAVQHHFNKIALGHHADDNAELVLMYLLRGSGAAGLSGIPPVRDGRYVRPLIHLSRRRILDFLLENKIAYQTDSSNTDPRYARNRIRHHLIPMLQDDYNPNIVQTLNRTADIFRTEESWLESIADELFGRCLLRHAPGRLVLSVPELGKMPTAARRRVIRTAVFKIKGNLRRVGLVHVERLSTALLEDDSPAAGTFHLPGRIRVTRKGPELVIVRENTSLRQAAPGPAAPDFQYETAVSGRLNDPVELWIENIGCRLRFAALAAKDAGDWTGMPSDTAFFDMAKLRFPLMVRNVRKGDRFAPLGLGGTQKLKTFFINSKIPVGVRKRIPLLVSGSDIIWVAGHRISDVAKVSAASKNLLRVQLLLA